MTTLYFRNNGYASAWKNATGAYFTNLAGSSANWYWSSELQTTRGSVLASYTTTSVAGPTNGIEYGTATSFVTYPLASEVTISGSVSYNLWGYESSMSANAAIGMRLFVLRRLDASLVEIGKGYNTTELGTSPAVRTGSFTPTSTTCYIGDRLVAMPYFDDASGVNMGSPYNLYFDFSGPTASADGDSYFSTTETLSFDSSYTATTALYLTNNVLSGVGSNTSYEAWTTNNSSSQNAVTNTAAGPTSPLWLTTSAGGSYVEWFTRPLQAVTFNGEIYTNLVLSESNAAANVTFGLEVAITAGDGTSPTVVSRGGFNGEASGSTFTVVFPVGSTAITDGQRIRFRFYMDDTLGGVGSTAGDPMATGYTGTLNYNLSSSYLWVAQTLLEYSATPTRLATRLPRRTLQAVNRAGTY